MPETSLLTKVSTLTEAEDTLAGQLRDYDDHPDEWPAEPALSAGRSPPAGERAAVTDHDVLIMQEVHHRVRNSLQMVQSLLNLQARQTDDAAVAQQLSDSAARIKAVGEMHNRLYRTEECLDVDIAPYLTQLVNDLRNSLIIPLHDREIVLDAGAGCWPAAESLSLGLVMTELVTNALRYGRGTVLIRFQEEDEHSGLLIVEDEGMLPSDFDPLKSSGFGMRLVHTLLIQRGGSLTIDRTAGHTRFIARMPPVTRQ